MLGFAILGILLGDWGSFGGLGVSLGILILASVIAFLRKWSLRFVSIGACVTTLLFFVLQIGALRHAQRFPIAEELSQGETVEITGKGWIASPVREFNRSSSMTVMLESLSMDGKTFSCRQKVPCRIEKLVTGLEYGSRIEFEGLMIPLEGPGSPGAFDAKAFYFRQLGALGSLRIRHGDPVRVLEERVGSPLVASALKLRSHLENGLQRGLPEDVRDYAHLIAAMTLGARENSPEELEELFRLSGTMHLFAVSGLHVGVVAYILFMTALWMRFPKRRAVLIVIPLILFYALLTGLRPSAVRAAIMLSVFLGGIAISEQARVLNSLGLAGLIILLIHPQDLFRAGFQLSFAVLFCIAVLAPGLKELLSKPFLTDPFIPRSLLSFRQRSGNWLANLIAGALALSICAWMGSAGLLSAHFQSLAPIGVIANLFMIPIASMIICVAMVGFICQGLHLGWLLVLMNKLNVGLAIILTLMAQYFSTLPNANFHTGGPGGEKPVEELRLEILGQNGDSAILISMPGVEEKFWVIDSGGVRTYQNELLPLLRKKGINRLEGAFITHGDSGHIGAMPVLLETVRPKVLIEPNAKNRARSYPDILRKAEAFDIEKRQVSAGDVPLETDGVKIVVLSPNGSGTGRIADDRALVLLVEYKGWRILLTSDAGFDTEKELIEAGKNLSADVWIRGQHNALPSGLEEFVSEVDPRIVVSSHSDYPVSEIISESLRENLKRRGTSLFTLDKAGMVTLSAKSGSLSVIPYSNPDSGVELTEQE